MRNNTSEISAPRQLIPSRRTGTAATVLAAIMSMTAASSAHAGDVIFGIGNDIKRGGGAKGGVDATARASADAANKAVAAALKRFEATDTNVVAALKAATAAAEAAATAVSKLRDLEARLAALESSAKRSGDAPSPTPPKDKDRDLPSDATPTGDKGDKSGERSSPPAAPPREPTDEEIVAAAAAARSRLEIKAAVANAAQAAAEAEVRARRAQEALMRAQVQKAQAAADLAQAIADQRAAKLAEAQAASNAANAQAAGLNGQARAANSSLDSVRSELKNAEDRSSKAAQDAQAANGVLSRLNGTVGAPGSSRLTTREPYAPVTYGGETPQFFGEGVGNIGLNLSSGSDFRGGIGAAGFARLGEHVAAGVRGEVGGGTRLIRMEGEQNVLGSSSDASIMGALQLGTVGGENGVNVEVAGGVMRESQMGVAYGANGSERSGVANVSPKFSATLAGYILVSPEIRLKVKCGLDLILGRPTQLGSDVRENAVGIGLGIGISTK